MHATTMKLNKKIINKRKEKKLNGKDEDEHQLLKEWKNERSKVILYKM